MNSSPEQSSGSTYMSGQTAQEVQTGRASREAATATLAAPTKPHADLPGELDIDLHRDRRRRTVIVAALGALALLVALVLVAGDTSRTGSEVAPPAGNYTGDWKDGLVEQGGSQPYTGDWKDGLIMRSGSQPYAGDWKDMLAERGR